MNLEPRELLRIDNHRNQNQIRALVRSLRFAAGCTLVRIEEEFDP